MASDKYLEALQELKVIPRVGDKLPGMVVESVEIDKNDPRHVLLTCKVSTPVNSVKGVITLDKKL